MDDRDDLAELRSTLATLYPDPVDRIRFCTGLLIDAIDGAGGVGAKEVPCPCCEGKLAVFIGKGKKRAGLGHSVPPCPVFEKAQAALRAHVESVS